MTRTIAAAPLLPSLALARPRGRHRAHPTSAPGLTGIRAKRRGLGPAAVSAATDQGIARQPETLAPMPSPIAGGALGGPDMDPVLAPAAVKARIVGGRIGIDRLRPGISLRRRSGGAIRVAAEGGRLALRPAPGGFSIGAGPTDAPVVQPGTGCSRGVVHKIDHVLVR